MANPSSTPPALPLPVPAPRASPALPVLVPGHRSQPPLPLPPVSGRVLRHRSSLQPLPLHHIWRQSEKPRRGGMKDSHGYIRWEPLRSVLGDIDRLNLRNLRGLYAMT